MSVATWVQQTKNTYLGNATAVRDYRVQLRGNRSLILFGLYLAALIGIALIYYMDTASSTMVSVVEAQRRLKGFYQLIMALLGTMIALVTPALSATTVITERQRQSLDLVFSAPVTPRYFLVGKMISSYRYTWMLLALSLPVTAACVVLGGASWTDVIGAFVLLSIHALIFTSIALLISTIASKPVSAIVWAYAATGLYCLVTGGFSVAMVARGFGFRTTDEMPFYVALSPFTVSESSSTYTVVFGQNVPNYLLVLVVALLISKICLLAAGAIISPYGGKEVKSLRAHGLVYMAAFTGGMGYVLGSSGSTNPAIWAGLTLNWALMPLVVLLPFVTCYGFDGERRFWPNGLASARRMLDGTPAGGLPFLLTLVLLSAVAVAGGAMASGSKIGALYLPYVLYAVGFWSFFWAVGRYASSFLQGVKSARTIQFGVFVVICVLPVPFLSALTNETFSNSSFNVWDLLVLRPIMQDQIERATQAGVYGALLLVLAAAITARSESIFKQRQEARRQGYDGNIAAA